MKVVRVPACVQVLDARFETDIVFVLSVSLYDCVLNDSIRSVWWKDRVTIPWHITSILEQDLEGRMHRPMTRQATYRTSVQKTLYRVTTLIALSSVAIFSVTNTATASLRSFFGDAQDAVVADEQSSRPVVVDNSQTVTLPQAARNVDPNISRGGGTIGVLDGVALVAEESPFAGSAGEQAEPASPDQISWYIVQNGDTLSQVATLFNVSINTIVWANDLSSNKDIHPGQTLLILPISGVQHKVVKGDTLKSIAKKYNGDADEIFAYNSLPEDGTLTVGETVTIPGGEVPEERVEKTVAKKGSAGSSAGSGASGYIHPMPGSVRTQGIHGYNGIDFGAPVGTPVRSAAKGTVIVSRTGSWNGGYGNYVVIDHGNGTQTLYGHLSKNSVWQGQSVVAGQVIGACGNTGRSTGPHLHFEVRGAKNPF